MISKQNAEKWQITKPAVKYPKRIAIIIGKTIQVFYHK